MIGALGLLFALASAPGPAEVLHQDAYRFCNEAGYPLLDEERAWCPLVGERNAICPALPAACAAPADDAAARRRRARDEDGEAADGCAGGSRTEEPDAAPKAPRSEPTAPPAAVSALAKALFFLMIACGLAAVIRAIARSRHGDRGDDDDDGRAAPDPAAAPSPAGEPGSRGPVETDVARLLARAQAAASRGDFDRALADAYAALLRRLDGDGLIEIHPGRTNGDYLRALGDRTELRAAVRAIFRDVERAQFGAAPATRGAFDGVYARVVPLASRALGAALLCLFLGTAGLSCGRHGSARTPASGDTSPLGTRALSELLKARDITVSRRTRALSQIDGERVALVLLPGAEVEPEAWQRLFTWVEKQGGVLVIAGPEPPAALSHVKREAEPGASPLLEVGGRFEELVVPGVLAVPGLASLAADTFDLKTLLSRSAAVGGPAENTASDSRLYATHQRLGSGAVVTLPNGDLLTNIALTVGANGDFVAGLLGSFELPVELCDRWTGVGATSPVSSVREAELTPAVLQLLAFAALLLLWKGAAFGALRDPKERSRRAFADHVRALGLCYARARAAPHVCRLYAGWALDRLRERGAGDLRARAGLAPLAEAIAARTGRPEPEVVEVLVEAYGARDATGPADEARSLALMRELTRMLAVTSKGRPRTP